MFTKILKYILPLSPKKSMRCFSGDVDVNDTLRVAICGAGTIAGQMLGFFLKQSKINVEISMYDQAPIVGNITKQLDLIDTRNHVEIFNGPIKLKNALKGADIVAILIKSKFIKPTSNLSLFEYNFQQVGNIAKCCIEVCPNAIIAIATEPINCIVPATCEIFKYFDLENDHRVLGITSMDVMQAAIVYANMYNFDPGDIYVPLTGGASADTIVPIFSEAAPIVTGEIGRDHPERMYNAFLQRKSIENESEIAYGYSCMKFIESIMNALLGKKDIVETAFVAAPETASAKYMTSLIDLGENGIETVYDAPINLNRFEKRCMQTAMSNLQRDIAAAEKHLYVPTRLWGFSGHVQTVIHSIVGRVKCPWPLGERCYLSLHDGSTLTYDLYQPLTEHEDDVTIAICPGIGNSSESVYVRTFVHYAQCHGYRCAVLNHIGALSSVQVTSSRIFTYGHTDDYAAMVANLFKKYPSSHLCLIGFSLGGNLVTKYMGDLTIKKPHGVIGAISVCQGYNAVEGTQWLLNWQNFRRFYLYVMTENMKNIIMRHRHVLLTDEVKTNYNLNEREIIAAATLPELDEAYTRRIHNFSSVTELYKWSSCINYLDNIEQPMVFMNSRDDPLVPENLLNPIKEFANTHSKAAYIEVAHGGHLGFYEGGLLYPNPVTWLDRALIAIVGSILNHHSQQQKISVI